MFAAIWIDYDDTETVSLIVFMKDKADVSGMYDDHHRPTKHY